MCGKIKMKGDDSNSLSARSNDNALRSRVIVQEKTTFWQDPKWAERHFTSSGKRPQAVAAPILKCVLSHVPAASKILDVGCGHGRYSIPLAEAGHRVTATDVSQAMLDILDRNRGDLPIEIRCGDAYALPAENAEFDVVFSNDFMGHFPDWQTLLKEQCRVCRVGGRLVFSLAFAEHREWAGQFEGLEPFDHPYSSDLLSKRPYWVETSRSELEQVAAQLGLKVMNLIPLKHFNESFCLAVLSALKGIGCF